MRYTYHLRTLSAITGVLIFLPGAEVFAGRGGASRCSSGAYGSVHQSAYHSTSASGGEAGYSREATGAGGKTLSSTGSETHLMTFETFWNIVSLSLNTTRSTEALRSPSEIPADAS